MANVTRSQLSTTSAANFPDNTSQLISPYDLRDWITDGIDSFVTQKDVSTFQNAFYECKGSTLTAAPTVFLGLATGNFVHISGTTSINSFGAVSAGARFILYFEDAVVVTYNATSLIIPGAANITTTAGDCMMVISEGSGNWRVVGYFPGTGLPVGTVTAVTASAPISSTGGNAPDISITQADSTTDGYLSSADWNTFDGKQDALSAGTGISIASNIVTNTAPDQTVALTAGTGIGVSGTYPSFTITNTSPSSGGTITGVTAGTGLSGGGTSGTVTVNLANTSVTPNSYTSANITIDAQGRITAASNGTGGGSPGGSNGDFQYKNGGSFDGSSLLRLQSGFVVAQTPKIGDSTTTGHFHMHRIASIPGGITDYLTMFWDRTLRAIGFKHENESFVSQIAFTQPTADRTYTLPNASGNVLIDSVIPSLNNGTSAGEIRLKEATASGSNYIAIKSPSALASDVSFTLPNADGSSGQIIQTDGSGNLSWVNNTGGTFVSQYISSTTPTTYSSTSLGVLVSILIPANTFGSGDVFQIRTRESKTGGASSTIRMGFNTSASLVGINYITATATVPGSPNLSERTISINSTTSSYVNSGNAGWGSFGSETGINTISQTTLIDWTVDQYFIVATLAGTGDVFTHIFTTIIPQN